MSKKLAVLAAAYGLPAPFTIASLAAKAGVSGSTAQTVIGRLPEDWFDKSALPSGARGGQPMGYTLSNVGRRAIEGSFEKVNVMPRLAPEQPAFQAPLGLLSAQATMRDMASAPEAARPGLLEDALGNLLWAEEEVQAGIFSTKSTELLAQIARLRQQLNGSDPKKVGAAPEASAAKEHPRNLINVAKERLAYWKGVVTQTLNGISANEQPPYVVIAYLDANQGSRELATFAKGALTTAFQLGRAEKTSDFNLVVEPFAASYLMAATDEGLSPSFERASELFLCINSAAGETEVRRALQQVNAGNMPKATVVLDEGFSAQVESFARQLDMDYAPNAAEPAQMAWVGRAIS